MSAISVNNVTFKYSKQNVLDNFCAQVNAGEIYALLGPSGGGKTTLLRMILGRIKLQQGFISVFGQRPGAANDRISYMPQNSALCMQFTVAQTLQYFMHIYRISSNEFSNRYAKLQKLLELPANECVINSLSGGQQRRISLACALLNHPSLVILDEPTVGIDLLIIHNIWKYLNMRCREGLTILFVTHYIEEATNAHKVGLMRNGRLLAEENPRKLCDDFGEKSLESVFLRLCLLDNNCHRNVNSNTNNNYNHNNDKNILNKNNENNIDKNCHTNTVNNANIYNINNGIVVNNNYKNILYTNNNNNNDNKVYAENYQNLCADFDSQPKPKPKPNRVLNPLKSLDEQKSLIDTLVFNLWIIVILIKRNALKYMNMSCALICILLPATQVVIYCLVYSRPLIEITAAVFNEERHDTEHPAYSTELLASLLPVERHLIRPVMHPTLQSAIQAVRNGSAVGAIWFKHNYSDSLDDRLDDPMGDDLDVSVYDTSAVHTYLDNSHIMFGNAFTHSLSESVLKFVTKLTRDRNLTAIEIPITVEKTVQSESLLIKDTGLSANLIFYVYLSQIVLSSLVLTQERKDGLFERSLIAGVSHHLVLVSHLCTNFVISLVQILLMYGTAFWVFDEVNNNGSGCLIVAYLTTEALNAITSGLLISAALKEEYHCLIILGFLCAPQLFTSGMFWPLESLDRYLRYANLCSPLAIPVETMRNIILRGWQFSNSNILFGFGVNLVPSVLFLIMALFIFRYREI
ncbi:unnamed protein product [Oppiella nova]|uniref:ABC transporter domain-containing protein n=1 Tax=Oppiella nova TaxID=334625 RepID=A0A7R9LSU8_9ACAR|nr:unnamed protein product [Oppiella nova]CAG2166561.1 unnamed protein product [Oppiella nova]